MSRCKATRADGQRCRANAQAESDFCYWHNPAARDDMMAASRRGGKGNRRNVNLPEGQPLTPKRVRAILAGITEALLKGAVSAETARAVGYLLQIEQKIYDNRELEKRLEALERAVANSTQFSGATQ